MLEGCGNNFQLFLKRNLKHQTSKVKLTFFEIFGSGAENDQKSRIRKQAVTTPLNRTRGQPTIRRASMGPCKCPKMDFVVGAQVWVGVLRPFLTGARISAQKPRFSGSVFARVFGAHRMLGGGSNLVFWTQGESRMSVDVLIALLRALVVEICAKKLIKVKFW